MSKEPAVNVGVRATLKLFSPICLITVIELNWNHPPTHGCVERV